MNGPRKKPGLWRDTEAQALTEFALVIPVVLMMFLTIIQYMMVVHALQLGNFAAYAASRAYAVNIVGGSDADNKAMMAAAMAYSPISYPFSGESRFHSSLNLEQFMRSRLTGMGVPSEYATRIGLFDAS